MGTIGTFDGFTTARLGIYAAQHGLNITGNNISNLNTEGYTRQRIDQVSWKTGGNDMYQSPYDIHMGNGAMVTGVNQIRDPYLDIQFRTVNSKVGYTDAWLSGLQDIAQTLDEVGKGTATNKNDEGDGILYAQLQDLRDMLMQLHNNPDKANDTLVRNSADTLCQILNTYAKALETTRTDLDKQFTSELSNVNQLLTDIRDLNDSIRKAEICGDSALELRDERNLKIDELSEYMSIKVEYTMEDIGAGRQVEKLKISLGNANPDADVHTDETVLIDGIYGAQLKCENGVPIANPKYDPDDNTSLPYVKPDGTSTGDPAEAATRDYVISVTNLVDSKNVLPKDHNEVNAGRPITLADNDLYGSFQAMRELLTEKGEFSTQADVDADVNAAIKRGIPYYQKSFDLLAMKIAEVYNGLNQGPLTDQDGNVIYEEQAAAGKTPEELGLTKVEDADSPGNGYYADSNGCYVGQHGEICLMVDAQLSANDSLAESMKKLSGINDGNWSTQAAAVLDQDGNIAAGQEDAAKQILAGFLDQHGVSEDNGAVAADGTLTVGKILASTSPEGVGPLFSNNNSGDDTEGITAANISVSHSWSTGDVKVVPRFHLLFDGDIKDSTQNTNIDHMITKIDETLLYNPKDLDPDAISSKLFEGSFNDMFSNMNSELALDRRTLNTQLDTHYTRATDLDTRRINVSGVDLNDEAMNIMMYQKAYSAACRMMTAIDEALDRLINNTGLAGL